MSKFGEELSESLTEAVAHAHGEKMGLRVHTVGDTRCRSDPPQAARVAGAICGDLPHPSFDTQKLGTRPPAPRRACCRLSASHCPPAPGNQ
jgi:hypothetical protein